VPAANFLILYVGSECVRDGPCLIPVAPGLSAPSGVLMVGLALTLRDLVQRRLGVKVSALAVLVGAAMSAIFSPPALVLASAAAFLLSEFADLGVYTPLQRRGLGLAATASSIVGIVVDSIVFLWIAFGDLAFLAGQVIGKGWMVLACIPFLYWLRQRDARMGLHPV
jgi:queuosine precursor transporter